jgi:cellulose synthase operon protein C
MLMIAERGPIFLSAEDLSEVRALSEEGLSLQAYERAKTFGPLDRWRGTSARILAGALAGNLGASRLGGALRVLAYRDDPADPEACFAYSVELMARHGPLRTWEFLKAIGRLPGATPRIRGYWLSMHAFVLGTLRDFDAAETWLARAEEADPAETWLLLQRSKLLEMEDRYEEALIAAREALVRRPWYRTAVQQVAHLLQLLDRDEEALGLLAEAVERNESSVIVAQLGGLQAEMGRHSEARRTWDRFEAACPLMDAPTRRWLAGRRSDAAYQCGAIDQAAALARECREPFFLALAPRLEAADADNRRILLDVGFVRQHHQTCAPATLAAIARFWGKPADQFEVAEAICYDGTPDHRQRAWAERNGWIPREFTVTWESARALLDRGVPFTMATVETQSAHLQAVIGYDARRGTLLIRDPTLRSSGEAMAEAMLERYRSVGPRGMAMVPAERVELLDGLELPEATLYDHLHRLEVGLHDHDRDRAVAEYNALRDAVPGHRLVHHARCVLAHYDADTSELLAGIEAQLEAYPGDVNLRMGQLSCLRVLGRRDERLAVYRELCGRPDADPLFRRQYAQELMGDAREHRTVVRLVRRALCTRPLDAPGFATLAEVARDGRRLDEAVELYRFAACLDDKDEGLAQTYFATARHIQREDDALQFLEGRARRYGTRSSRPARTLCWALTELERKPEALEVLEESLRLRHGDGELLTFAAEVHGARGEFDRAIARLDAAMGLCRRGDWLRSAAYLESLRGNLADSLNLWRQVLQIEPAAIDANRAVAKRLAESEGRAAALDHLARACDRFPHNYALHQARIEWLREDGPAAVEPAVRLLLASHSDDAWARRELALVLARQGRHDEAAAELAIATQIEPASPAEAMVRGQVLDLAGHQAEAREAYREAILRSVDSEFAIGRLIGTCDSQAERVEALAFIEGELARQVYLGDGLLAFARHARSAGEPDALLAALREAREARPDLWQAWSALVQELIGREQLDEAFDLARQATSRFPFHARIWLDLASVARARADRDGELEALDRALRITPGWGNAARQRAVAFEKDGNYAESRAILERAVAHGPLDPFNHGCLADALWHLDEKDSALDRLAHALRLNSDYEWAWDSLRDWSRELARPEVPIELARELTRSRGGEARNWLTLARFLDGPERLDERLEAVDRAIELDPRGFAAHDLKAEILVEAGRWDEAEASCRPSAWGDRPPIALRGRAAWISARRGDLADAMARMRPVLAQSPDYYWGWLNLVEWACEAGTPAEYLEAAEGLVRLAASDHVAAGYRADARLKTGDRAGAKDEFRRAFALKPAHGYTSLSLFDLELEDEDLEAAGRVLEALKVHIGGVFVLVREVQLANAAGDQTAAIAALRRLCATPPANSEWPLTAADRAFKERAWGRQAESIYAEALDRPDVPPQVGTLWVEHCASRRDWRCIRRIDVLLGRGEVGRRALVAYLVALGRAKAARRIAHCLRRHSEICREHTQCWGAVGFALTSVVRHHAAADWLADWTGRTELQPWMLINLVLSLRALGRDDEANRVSRRAVELSPDYTIAHHKIWLALDDILDGDGREVNVHLDGIDPPSLDCTNQYLFNLARLLTWRKHAQPVDRDRIRKSTARELASLGRKFRIPADDYRAVRRAYHRAIHRIAADYRPVTGFLWRLIRRRHAPRIQQ